MELLAYLGSEAGFFSLCHHYSPRPRPKRFEFPTRTNPCFPLLNPLPSDPPFSRAPAPPIKIGFRVGMEIVLAVGRSTPPPLPRCWVFFPAPPSTLPHTPRPFPRLIPAARPRRASLNRKVDAKAWEFRVCALYFVAKLDSEYISPHSSL